jgi:ferrous iron transport protein B
MFTAALVGNPNVGKTTLFNLLTGSNQYVGNWAGVTVEKKEGYINEDEKLVDLPGIYAMDTYSNEEKVSKQFLLSGNVDVIINIVDASNLNRNLYLTTQIKEFGIPIILVLNMIDSAEAKGIKIDYKKLSEKLNVTVIPIVAAKGKGIDKIINILKSGNFFKPSNDNDYHFQNEEKAYSFIEETLNHSVTYSSITKTTTSEKIDRILLNKYLAYPLFLTILYIIFKFTFNWVGQPLADLLQAFLNNNIVAGLNTLLAASSPWFKSLIIQGIVGGVGSVIVFLPIILSLFLGISILEDSGYMARAAFIMDKLMRKMGLSGKAFIPLIVGFGCSVPAVMSARTLESEKDRKLTALLVPLMSCNARLPVYGLFAAALFTQNKATIVFSLYLIGILMAFLIGLLFRHTIFKKDEEPFLIELPEYKLPDIKNLFQHTFEKSKGFLKKAGTIIFAMSVLIWLLSNFNFTGYCSLNDSFLASIGKVLSVIFIPLGFGNWQSAVSLLAGLMAKEVIVDTMGVIYGPNLTHVLPTYFTQLSAFSFLVFVLLYTPCISVIATMKKEYGSKMAIFSLSYQILLAWVVSFLVFNIGRFII